MDEWRSSIRIGTIILDGVIILFTIPLFLFTLFGGTPTIFSIDDFPNDLLYVFIMMTAFMRATIVLINLLQPSSPPTLKGIPIGVLELVICALYVFTRMIYQYPEHGYGWYLLWYGFSIFRHSVGFIIYLLILFPGLTISIKQYSTVVTQRLHVTENIRRCESCDAPIEEGVNFCDKCGSSIIKAATGPTERINS